MTDRSVLIRVPATVGNFGGAAGCAALALDAALNVRASTRRDGGVRIRYFGENGERVPRDTQNLAVRAMQAALELKGLPFGGIDFEMYGSAPVGVGFGSSSAAVWAGLLAADRLYRLGLGEKALFDLADTLDRRSDNLRAAWSGGFIARFEDSASPAYRSTVVPDDLALQVVIPETNAVRNHELASDIPSHVDPSPFLNRAQSLSRFLAHTGDSSTPQFEEATMSLAEKTVPGLDEALRVRVPGLQAVFVCGSGPSIGFLAREQSVEAVARAIADCFTRHGVAFRRAVFRPANSGAREWNAGGTEIRLAPPVGLDMPDHRPLLV
jgi:homoserine kinase